MANSPSSLSISKDEPIQLPLRGFKVEVESPLEGWQKFHETTLDGRLRIHMVKKR